ncbi:hypothetical protein KJ657_01365 [Patescibacteria group bacterium]|nr:hypothetical protein [Patescibacteria group bacterium]MBU1015717.1 hypothetical protein [Patescibacteria group bacterium]MBU1684889.1 hypothetical protein [Patescibacteria group bacterium]MBU1938653.1 hypothetical protein [Patescibacteria group bacterium]
MNDSLKNEQLKAEGAEGVKSRQSQAPESLRAPEGEDPEKWAAIKRLITEEGRKRFMMTFEEKLKGYKALIQSGGGFLLKPQLSDMQETAAKLKERYPKTAEFIEQARAKVQQLLDWWEKNRKKEEK